MHFREPRHQILARPIHLERLRRHGDRGCWTDLDNPIATDQHRVPWQNALSIHRNDSDIDERHLGHPLGAR